MRRRDTPIAGAYLVDAEPHTDERGELVRLFCTDELRALGIDLQVAQASLSTNRRKGTVRGLHYQAAPHSESKLVRCLRGAVHDVIVDLRRDSPTYRRSFTVELRAERFDALFVPKGVAHGFQTLVDDSALLYMMDVAYAPAAARGVRHDDPAFGLRWPLPVAAISQRDRGFADFVE